MAATHRSSKGETTLVERLASWAIGIRDTDISAGVLRQTKLLVLDTLGCGLAALDDHTARAAVEFIRAMGGTPQCAVIGMRDQTSLQNAVIANGVLVRTLDLNDYVVDTGGGIGGHPSDNIPVALAAAEFDGRSGREALAAIVIGYEVYDRMKSAMGGRSPWDGVSVSGAVAPIIAGRLLGLDAPRLAHAIALSLAHASVSAMVRAGEISSAKCIANALVAEHGVRSVLLARQGVTGPLSILDHPRGMRAVFPDLDDVLALDAPIPDDLSIMHASVKVFPCIATGQALVAAGIAMHKQLAGDVSNLERIVITMADHPSIAAQQRDLSRADPQSREAADHSFPFLAAVSLLDGRFGLQQFENERWNDPAVRDVMNRLEMTPSSDLSKRAAARSFPCILEAHHKDLGTRREEILSPPGHSAGGLDEDVVRAKFVGNSEKAVGRAACDRLVEGVLAMDRAGSCSDAIAAIRFDA
jgi:2-methylcitrate dehydratase